MYKVNGEVFNNVRGEGVEGRGETSNRSIEGERRVLEGVSEN